MRHRQVFCVLMLCLFVQCFLQIADDAEVARGIAHAHVTGNARAAVDRVIEKNGKNVDRKSSRKLALVTARVKCTSPELVSRH